MAARSRRSVSTTVKHPVKHLAAKVSGAKMPVKHRETPVFTPRDPNWVGLRRPMGAIDSIGKFRAGPCKFPVKTGKVSGRYLGRPEPVCLGEALGRQPASLGAIADPVLEV